MGFLRNFGFRSMLVGFLSWPGGHTSQSSNILGTDHYSFIEEGVTFFVKKLVMKGKNCLQSKGKFFEIY